MESLAVTDAPLRIALVSMHTSPLASAGEGDAGGMNIMVYHGANALAHAGHHVSVFTRKASPHAPDVIRMASGAVIHQLPAGPLAPADKREQESFIAPFADALEAHWQNWDLVHSHHWFSGMAALKLAQAHGVPHLTSFHSIAADPATDLGEGERPEGPLRRSGEAQLARESDAVVAVSQAERMTAIGRLGAPASRVHVVAPGVDVDTFRPLAEQPLKYAGHHPRPLVAAARLEPLKGLDLAIRALALIPEPERAPLIIYGAPAGAYPGYGDELRRLAERLGVAEQVSLRGPQTRTALAQAFAGAAAVLVPSHSETYGLVALEAGASGRPVITSGAGGLSEAVQHGYSGLIVPERDPHAWAAAITAITGNSEYADELGRHGRSVALGHTWEAMAGRWADIYRELAAGSASSRA